MNIELITLQFILSISYANSLLSNIYFIFIINNNMLLILRGVIKIKLIVQYFKNYGYYA
jgi:hypothetical protein